MAVANGTYDEDVQSKNPQSQQQQPQTFARMQQQGVARPAPPSDINGSIPSQSNLQPMTAWQGRSPVGGATQPINTAPMQAGGPQMVAPPPVSTPAGGPPGRTRGDATTGQGMAGGAGQHQQAAQPAGGPNGTMPQGVQNMYDASGWGPAQGAGGQMQPGGAQQQQQLQPGQQRGLSAQGAAGGQSQLGGMLLNQLTGFQGYQNPYASQFGGMVQGLGTQYDNGMGNQLQQMLGGLGNQYSNPNQNQAQQALNGLGAQYSDPNMGAYGGAIQQNLGANFQAPLTGQTQQSVQNLLANPSAYNSDMVMNTYNQAKQGIDQTFNTDKTNLDQMMAKRGLYDSTMTGQKYSDLATEKDRSLTGLAQNLITQQAQQYGQDQTNAINAGMNFGNQALNVNQANMANRQGAIGQGLQLGQQGLNINQANQGNLQGALSGALQMGQQGLNQYQANQGALNNQFQAGAQLGQQNQNAYGLNQAARQNQFNAAQGVGQQGLNEYQTNAGVQQGYMNQALGYDQNQFSNSLNSAQYNQNQQNQMMALYSQLLGAGGTNG